MKSGKSAALLVCAGLVVGGMSSPEAAAQASQVKRPVISQVGASIRIFATGERPLLQALDALQEKYAWRVNYEDPRYTLEPQAQPQYPASRREPRARADSGGALVVEFAAGGRKGPDENSVLRLLVETYNQGNNPAEFELRAAANSRGNPSVVGVAARDAGREMQAQPPLLDLPVSLAAGTRSVGDALALLCGELSQAAGIPVTPPDAASLALPGAMAVTTNRGGAKIPARKLLAQTLAAAPGAAQWRLLYQAKEKSYNLELRASP